MKILDDKTIQEMVGKLVNIEELINSNDKTLIPNYPSLITFTFAFTIQYNQSP